MSSAQGQKDDLPPIWRSPSNPALTPSNALTNAYRSLWTHGHCREAERNGFHKLLDKLFTDNLAGIRLIQRCGFSSVGTHRRHGQLDGEWRDVMVVERVLSGAAAECDSLALSRRASPQST